MSKALLGFACIGQEVGIGTGRIARRQVLRAIMFTSTAPTNTTQNNDQRVF
tara:strand:+ start:1395 stop:1547 length:153 start_codon:yes stop_codon:yes gene_type:complete